MCTSVARPFDAITGSQGKQRLSTEWRRSGSSPDLNGAADASPGTQTCGTRGLHAGGTKPLGHLGTFLCCSQMLSWGSVLLAQCKRSRTRVTSKGLNRKDNDVCNE